MLGQFALVQGAMLIAVLLIARTRGVPLLALLAAFAVVSYWMARRLVLPLARVRERLELGAKRLATRDLTAEDFEEEGDDEWRDLESVVDRMRRDLRERSDALNRERSELATLMSAIAEAILAVDREGHPLFYNSKFMLLFGGKDFSRRLTPLRELFRAPELLKAFRVALEHGDSRTPQIALPVLSSDGQSERFFAISVSPLKRTDGAVYGAVGIFHDVTELKQAERIRIEFVANVSHELRTPLTAIKGFADTLRSDLEQGRLQDTRSHLDVIERNVDRLMALIGDLLDLSSLEASGEPQGELIADGVDTSSGGERGRAPFQRESVDTRELTERVLIALEPKRAKRGHSIVTRFDASHVYADPIRIEQVLINLIDNAIKYVREPGTIDVHWEQGAKWVRLHVKDSGPGIPPEHQSRLFERFYRIDPARSQSEVEGTGLGLAIVKHILQRHGGNVWVVSAPGRGADFICQFPPASA